MGKELIEASQIPKRQGDSCLPEQIAHVISEPLLRRPALYQILYQAALYRNQKNKALRNSLSRNAL